MCCSASGAGLDCDVQRDPPELEALLQQGDPPLDPIISPMGAAGFRLGTLLSAAPGNTDPLPEGLPPVLSALIADASRLPPSAEPTRLVRAAAFGQRHLSLLVVALFCSSLPRLFLGAKGALVLRATGRMEVELDERINETGRFVLDVWAPDALTPRGCALRSAVRVRLLHAVIRAHLHGKPGFEAIPINQEEQLATLLAFSVAALDGIRQLGVSVDPRDAEDVWCLWRTVGEVLGVSPRLLPDGVREARHRLDALEAAHAAPSIGGQALAAVLLRRIESHLPFSPGLARRLWTLMLGDHRVKLLGVEPGVPLAGWELTAIRAVGGQISPALLDLGVQLKLGGRTPTFSTTKATSLS